MLLQLDSFLGATIQRTRYSLDTKKILQDHAEPRANADIKVISGFNILTNNQVSCQFCWYMPGLIVHCTGQFTVFDLDFPCACEVGMSLSVQLLMP